MFLMQNVNVPSVLPSPKANLHCMTLGLESIAQMDDAIERVMRNTKG